MTYLVDGVQLGGDNPTSDAFGRLRVSNPVSLFDIQHEYDVNPLFWDQTTSGTASSSHDAANSAVTLTTGTTAADSIVRQSLQYMRYQPGKSQLVLMTFDLGSLASNNRARLGYFDADGGIFFQQYNGTRSVVLRKGGSDTAVASSSWSIDKMDGTGPSGVTMDFTKAQIFFVDMEWLGVGRVRCGFVIGGRPYVVHEFNHANTGSNVYMRSANLPIRYEVTNVDGGTAASMKQLCSTVMSEGGFETERGTPFSAGRGITTLNVGTTRVPLVSIRPKATFNSIAVRGTIIPTMVDVLTGATNTLIEVVYNGSLTSASFGSADTNSIVEFDTAATAITNGQVLSSFYVVSTGAGATATGAESRGLLSRLPITLDAAGSNPIPLSLCARALTGTSTCVGSINWVELR